MMLGSELQIEERFRIRLKKENRTRPNSMRHVWLLVH
uniref:Uncharacterized protein n=1 Tax=Arundo donax TaxID=35708 RepID=A0A0A8ZSD8_ARUDO